jgi:homoserine kinase type II
MAVYTEIQVEDLIEFLANYSIGTLLSYKGIAEGVENSNYLVHTTLGTYILTLYEKRVCCDDLPFFIGLMEHVAGKGILSPLPVRTRDGVALGMLSGKKAALVTFLDGMSVRRPDAEHCRLLGAALAQFHLAAQDFAMTRPNALSLDGWAHLSHGVRARADEVQAGLQDFLSQELAFLKQAWVNDLPKGIIHADLFPDNVFFLQGKVSGLIDFYFACSDMFAYDVAICLNAWCFEVDGSYNMTKGLSLLAGYQSVRCLTAAEVDAFAVLCRGAALRFLLTRLVDWLDVPEGALVRPKNPLEYYKKLRFHQTMHHAQDYGLTPCV